MKCGQSDGMGVSIGSHEDSETSERSEGTERTHTQSQSYSQTVHSTQSCSSATTTDTCTGTCTSTTGTTSRTETNGRGSGSEETTSLTPSLSHTTIAKGETPEGLVEEDEEEEEEEDQAESEVENAFLRAASPDEGLGKTAVSPGTPVRSPSPEAIQVQPTRSSSSNSITLLYQARTRQRPDDFMTMELFL